MKYTVCCTLAFIDFKSICLIYRTPSLSPCLERDGLEGSFGIFELRASFVGMPNVPESEGMVESWYYFLFLSFNFFSVLFTCSKKCFSTSEISSFLNSVYF